MILNLKIQRKTTTIFVTANENLLIKTFKKQLGDIFQLPPSNLQLYHENIAVNENTVLSAYVNHLLIGNPGEVSISFGLTFLTNNGEFENLEITPYSEPPELHPAFRYVDSYENEEF